MLIYSMPKRSRISKVGSLLALACSSAGMVISVSTLFIPGLIIGSIALFTSGFVIGRAFDI